MDINLFWDLMLFTRTCLKDEVIHLKVEKLILVRSRHKLLMNKTLMFMTAYFLYYYTQYVEYNFKPWSLYLKYVRYLCKYLHILQCIANYYIGFSSIFTNKYKVILKNLQWEVFSLSTNNYSFFFMKNCKLKNKHLKKVVYFISFT